MKIKLESTKNYNLFQAHELNRPLHDAGPLMESMKKHGFMPSSPIHCVRNGGEKLKVLRGHHRLHCAKRLSLPVWYVVDDSNKDIFDLEGSFGQVWTVRDFAYARASAGNPDYRTLLTFQKKHDLKIGSAASLVGGESAGSNNKSRMVKSGTFHAGDLSHANAVVRVTDRCRELGLSFATATGFVSAVSMALRIPEFDVEAFLTRISLYPKLMNRRGSSQDYLEEIDALYNYRARGKRIPVVFRAKEALAARKKTFGRNLGK